MKGRGRMSHFYNPVKLYIGIESLGYAARDMEYHLRQAERVLLLTRGQHVESNPALQPIMLLLKNKDVLIKEFHQSNPDLADVSKMRDEIGDYDFQLIIAIGGGSVMDMAKIISALQGSPLETVPMLRSMIDEANYCRKEYMTPWFAIPTTSGTGSEVTSWATLWDRELGCKYSIEDTRLYAAGAVLLPELTIEKPLRLTAVTALDALSHATEAYWAVRTNPISRMYALHAVQRIRTFLPKLKADPLDVENRMQIAQASLFAGLAFSNTKTTACHSISYPLTLLHGVEHGIAASFTLSAVMKLNKPVLYEPEKLLDAYGAANMDEVEDIIFGIYEWFGFETKLQAYGIRESDVTGIVDRAYTKGRMDNNPVEITKQQVTEILTDLL